MRAAKPEVNHVLRKLRALGLHLEFAAGAGHWRVIDPGTGAYLTSVSNTPSDVNWWHHVRRAVERAGFSWEGKARKRNKRSRGEQISTVDLEALAHAQHMARLHGEREPQIDDLANGSILAKVRKGFDEQETEEAIANMAQGVESARAHRVVSRLLYVVEQNGEAMAARARERNPKIRDGGAIHEIIYIAQQVAEKRGLRYWATPESAWQTLSTMLSGVSKGMSVWVANLLEATMDEMDGLRWDAKSEPADAPAPAAPVAPATALISIDDAKQLIVGVLSDDEWTPRSDFYGSLVPGQMTESRFGDALGELTRSGQVERERVKKLRGGMQYRLAVAGVERAEEPTEPEPVPQSDDGEPTLAISPEMLDHPPRSLVQAMTAGSIADRYADVLLEILRDQNINGTQDWRALEPILVRLDKLAGVIEDPA